jgi:hypothetical protein
LSPIPTTTHVTAPHTPHTRPTLMRLTLAHASGWRVQRQSARPFFRTPGHGAPRPCAH